jgi:hypothetical protein
MALQPKYENSHALIIGVNQYNKAPPLAYACNDAEAVAAVLKDRFGFPNTKVHLLRDYEIQRRRAQIFSPSFTDSPPILK